MEARVMRAVMREAYEMGTFAGEKQMEACELRATIERLNEDLVSLERKLMYLAEENDALRRKLEDLRGIEITD